MDDADLNDPSSGEVIASMLISAWKKGCFYVPAINWCQSGKYLLCYSLIAPRGACARLMGLNEKKFSKPKRYDTLSTTNASIRKFLKKYNMQLVSETLCSAVTVELSSHETSDVSVYEASSPNSESTMSEHGEDDNNDTCTEMSFNSAAQTTPSLTPNLRHASKTNMLLSKAASKVKSMLLTHMKAFERLLGPKGWTSSFWPSKMNEAFANDSAYDVSILLLQLEKMLTEAAQDGRPEWCGLPIGWMLQAGSWRDTAKNTQTFAQLASVVVEFVQLLEPFLSVYQRASTPEDETVFVPCIGKSYQFVDAYQLVRECLDAKDADSMWCPNKKQEAHIWSTASKVKVTGIRYCLDPSSEASLEIMINSCTDGSDLRCFFCGCSSGSLVKCRSLDCCRVACAKTCYHNFQTINRCTSEPKLQQQWDCPECACHGSSDPQHKLNFYFLEALRRANSCNASAIILNAMFRCIAANKYHNVIAFFHDLKSLAFGVNGMWTQFRLDLVHRIQKYLFENASLLKRAEEAVRNCGGKSEHTATVAFANAVSTGSSVSTGAPSPDIVPPVQMVFGSELSKADRETVEISSRSCRWIKYFTQGPNPFMPTQAFEAILNNPSRSYIEQRKFTAFLEQYADIYNPLRRKDKEFLEKDEKINQYDAV